MSMLLTENIIMYNVSLSKSLFISFSTSFYESLIKKYNYLILLHKEKKVNKKVIYYSKKVLDLQVESFGLFHTKTAIAYAKLAEAYLVYGDTGKSLKLYKKSLDININIFGMNSLESASIYSALANIYFSEDKLKDAFGYYLKALKIREKFLGTMHPLTAISHHELGYFYAASEEYLEALPHFEKSLKCRIELYRLSHPDTAKSYNSLAMCHYHLFNYTEAYEYLLKAIQIKEMILPKNDPSILGYKKNLLELKVYISNDKNTLLKRIAKWIKNL